MMNNSCLVGISGGIDSLFAAIELKNRGFKVICVKIHLHSKDPIPQSVINILNQNDISFYYADYKKEFNDIVIQNFIKEYSEGYTPNPCIICNMSVKMKALYKEAQKLSIPCIATGHYADFNNNFLIRHKSKKDQSYFLACVDREILENTIFPLTDFTKDDIQKKIAIDKRESSDLCFIKHNYRNLLLKKLGKRPGVIVKNGSIVGYHNGFFNYTIGQRKGIKVENRPHYVIKIDAENNSVEVDTEDKLFSNGIYLNNLNIYNESSLKSMYLLCQVRYNTKPKPCTIDKDSLYIKLFEKERAVTPGQIAVIYENDRVVACGRIKYGIH
jgi:tRNA-specific 2-thiouridylase